MALCAAMIHPHTELRKIDDEIGYGVFATHHIPRGTVTWVLDPLDIVVDAAMKADERYRALIDWYSFTDHRGQVVLCWDFARYMNHSCDPSCVGPGGTDFDVAIRDIAAGEELTYDYGALNLQKSLRCLCGVSRCRGTVSEADLDDRAPIMDQALRIAIADVATVHQPLWPWLGSMESTLREWARAPQQLPPSTAHRPRP